VFFTMSAVAGHSAFALGVDGGGPCTGQLGPEHCAELIAPGVPELPPQAIRNGTAASADSKPLEKACDILLSPFMYLCDVIWLCGYSVSIERTV
jgi:hypothetical protein